MIDNFDYIMSYRIFCGRLSDIELDTQNRLVINTLNPHSYIVASNDEIFSDALNDSEIILPDGVGILIAARLLNKRRIKKISGADLHHFLLSKINESGGSIFYMGSSEKTLELIKKKISKEFPNIRVGTYSPPFKPALSKADNAEIIKEINTFSPDILFIGMTAPKQEKWLHQNKDELNFKVASCIGAVFDFYAETVKRPSQIWINFHLEWLIRFLQEPRRLFYRNFISMPLFMYSIIKILIKQYINR